MPFNSVKRTSDTMVASFCDSGGTLFGTILRPLVALDVCKHVSSRDQKVVLQDAALEKHMQAISRGLNKTNSGMKEPPLFAEFDSTMHAR